MTDFSKVTAETQILPTDAVVLERSGVGKRGHISTLAETVGSLLVGVARDTYPNSAQSNVPRGVVGHGSITGGSGGTNGTFALAFTGGNFATNPTGTFTVDGGAVTAISFTTPGEYIGASPTAPTLSFAASSGLTGASAAATVGFLVSSGGRYWTLSADGNSLIQYQNVSGVATKVLPETSIPTAGALNAQIATVGAQIATQEALANSALQTRGGFFRTPPSWDVGMPQPVKIGAINGIVAAFAKRDATFKAGWRDGNGLKYQDSATGDIWESVSLAKMKDPQANGTTLTEVYHHYTTGADANAGTIGSHKKNFSAALAVSGDLHIRPLSNIVGSTSMARNWSKNNIVKITGSRADGKPTYIVDMRDNFSLSWTDLGDGVFQTNGSINFNVKNGPILSNIRTLDANGNELIYKYDSATYADVAARKAALLALADVGEGAWLIDATPGGTTQGWYIKTADGLAPDFGPNASHVYSEASNIARWEPYANKLIYCENLAFVYNAKTAVQSAIQFRTQGFTAGLNQEWLGELALYNCRFAFAGKQGIQTDDLKRINIDRFVSYANREDSVNPHSLNTKGGVSPIEGSYMRMTLSNGICDGVGNFGWRDQDTLSRSGNALTVHDYINLTAFNIIGGNTFGAVCAMVGGSKSWLINCHMHSPTNPDGEGPITGNLGNAGSPSAPYWADGANTELWLSMCSGNGGYETLVATNGAKIYLDNFVGNWTGRVAGGGQILDFDGNILLS